MPEIRFPLTADIEEKVAVIKERLKIQRSTELLKFLITEKYQQLTGRGHEE